MTNKPTRKRDHEDTDTPSKTCPSCGKTFFRDNRCTRSYWAKAKYCSRECFGKSRSEQASAKRNPIDVEFRRHFKQTDGCWEWTWIKDKDGYALFPYAGKQYRAAKLALALDGRPVQRGKYACHTCDNPSCVKPGHLYPGTPKQNSADAISRGRNVRGEQVHASKLTEEDVRAIRASTDRCGALARKYGVNHANISMIRSRKTWRHVA